MDEATAVGMGASLCAVFFDRPAGRRQRMQAEQDGGPVPRPFIAAQFPLRSGGTRHVLFVPQGIDTLLSRHLLLRLDGVPAARIDPDWLQLPQGDLSTLTAQLSAAGLHRMLRVLLTTGASLFAGPAETGLAAAAPDLLDICDIPALSPTARCQIAGRALVTYAAPGLSGAGKPADAVAILDGRLVRLRDFDCLAHGDRLHVLLPRGLRPGRIVAFGERPLRLDGGDASLRRVPVSDWVRVQGRAGGDWLSARLGGAVALAPNPAPGTEPTVAVRHLSALAVGLLHVLVLHDPSRRVQRVVLERQGRQAVLTPSHGADGTAMLVGFADLPGGAGGDTCRISILEQGGHRRALASLPLAAFDGTVPPAFEDVWTAGADALWPLARARAAFRRAPPPSLTYHFGPARKCGLRIVTAIGSSVDLIRARAALILAEAHATPVEVICTMLDGPLAVGARHALAQTAAIYDIPHRLMLLPAKATAGEGIHAALSDARDAPVLVLGPDVLPDGPGWLSFWLRRLRRRDAVAPVLLASDGSIAATREGADPCRGLPPACLPALGRGADRPLAACLALAPSGVARLLDGNAPHPDAALWFAAALGGAARTESRHPFRRFGPAAPVSGFAAALAETGFALIEKVRR